MYPAQFVELITVSAVFEVGDDVGLDEEDGEGDVNGFGVVEVGERGRTNFNFYMRKYKQAKRPNENSSYQQ